MADAPQVEEGSPGPADELENDPEHPGLECPECGELVRGKGRWRDSTALGLHRRQAHDVVGASATSSRARAKRGTSSSSSSSKSKRDGGGVRPLSLVHDVARDAKGRGAPTAAQLTNAMGTAYGYATVLGASLAVGNAPLTDEDRERLIDYLSATPDEATATMAPIARAIAKTEVVKRYGRGAIDNVDVLDAVAAIAQQVMRWRSVTRELRAMSAGAAPVSFLPPDGGAGVAPPPTEAFDPRATFVPPQPQGVVVTPAMAGRPDLEAEWMGRGEGGVIS